MRIRRGFTIAELAVSLMLMSILSATFMIGIVKNRRFGRGVAHQEVALILAKNELESLRAAGPESAATFVGERTIDSAGLTDPAGEYRVIITSETLCQGGAAVAEDTNSLVTGACVNERNAILRYGVAVVYPGRAGPDTLHYSLDLSERGRFGGERATY